MRKEIGHINYALGGLKIFWIGDRTEMIKRLEERKEKLVAEINKEKEK